MLLTQKCTGIYHLASPKSTSPYNFGVHLLKTFGRNPKTINKGTLQSSIGKSDITPRPLKGGMQTNKIEKLGFKPTNWINGLNEIFNQSKGQLI